MIEIIISKILVKERPLTGQETRRKRNKKSSRPFGGEGGEEKSEVTDRCIRAKYSTLQSRKCWISNNTGVKEN